MKVGELFLALGLVVEDKQWSLGQAVIDKMAADLKRLAVSAALATTDVKKAMNVIGISAPAKAAKKTLAEMVKTGDGVTNTFRRMLLAAGSFFALSKIKEMVSNTVELGGKLNDTAQKTGLSAAALQELGYAAGLNSSSLDEVASSVIKLSKGLDDVKTGKGPVVEAFTALGISLNDPAVKAKNLDGILSTVASKFETMPDGANKTAIAVKLFGKSGANLIPTLNQGQRGLANLRQEARDLGIVMGDDAVAGLDDLGDQVDKVKETINGLKNQAIVALMPLLREMADAFFEWVKANKEIIASTITSVVRGLATALKLMGSGLLFVVDHWKLFAALLAAGAVVSGLMAIIRLIVFFQAVQTRAAIAAVINWIMILGPILLIAAAIVLLGLLIYKFRDKIKAALGKVRDFFVGLWRKMKDVGSSIVQAFVDVGEGIKTAFGAAFDWAYEKAKELSNKIRNFPVIKQLIDFGQWIGKKARGDKIDMDESAKKTWGQMFPGRALPTTQREFDDAFAEKDAANAAPVQGAQGPSAAANAPKREGVASSGAVRVENNYSIQIDAKNADAREVASLVDQKLKEHDELTRRQTAAGLGVA